MGVVVSIDKKRKERNDDIIKDLKAGKYIRSFNKMESWWPSRPIVKKDKEAIKKLYDKD